MRTQLILPHRDFTIRGQMMAEIEHKIRRAWPDQILPTDRLKLTTVRPSPNVGYTGRKPLHILIEINRPRNSQLHPILIAHRELTAQGPSPNIFWVPVLVATPVGITTLHNICAPPCRSDQMLIPLPGRLRRWLSPDHGGRHIADGLFLPIWWDLRLRPQPVPAYEQDDQQALIQVGPASVTGGAVVDLTLDDTSLDATVLSFEDDEAVVFMQQHTPTLSNQTSEPSFLVVHTFHMSTEYKLIQLVWKPPRSEVIVALHDVNDPPQELQNTAEGTILVEMTQDSLRKASDSDVMILTDIQISDPRSRMQGIKLRKTAWARGAMTRTQVLQMFSADSLCTEGAIDCTLWRNKVLWPSTDTATRHLENGDFIHVLVRSLHLHTVQEVYSNLCQQESASSQRYSYHRSPPHDEDFPNDNEAVESTEQARGASDRSRSRERSVSLLQHKAELATRKSNPSLKVTCDENLVVDLTDADSQPVLHQRPPLGDITNCLVDTLHKKLPPSQGHPLVHPDPCSKPHVTDRWCASQVNSDDPNGSPEGDMETNSCSGRSHSG